MHFSDGLGFFKKRVWLTPLMTNILQKSSRGEMCRQLGGNMDFTCYVLRQTLDNVHPQVHPFAVIKNK